MIDCPRCGKPFEPKPTSIKAIPMTRFCEDCGLRNLFDGLDMPTPPEMLDVYTKNPALTDDDFRRQLHANVEEDEAEQRFVESMTQHCHCEPASRRPCDGVLQGGVCDEVREELNGDQSEPDLERDEE